MSTQVNLRFFYKIPDSVLMHCPDIINRSEDFQIAAIASLEKAFKEIFPEFSEIQRSVPTIECVSWYD